jgi:hypothetical protein
MTTLLLAGWLVALFYGVRAGGPRAIVRALRDPRVPRRYKVALALCALPIPGPVDEIVAVALLARIARRAHDERTDR